MEKHLTLLGVLYIVFSVSGILAGLIVFTVLVGLSPVYNDATAVTVTGIVGTVVGGFLFLLSVPGLIAGIGLLQHKAWARILALVLGILNLLSIPVGTLLGIYTLWVLLDDNSTQVFAATA